MLKPTKPHRVVEAGSGLIVALDPSPNNIGVAVLDVTRWHPSYKPVAIKTITYEAKSDLSMVEKALRGARCVDKILQEHKPMLVAIEDVAGVSRSKHIAGENRWDVSPAMMEQKGMLRLLAYCRKMPVLFISPNKWKGYHGITGDQQKHQAWNLAAKLADIPPTRFTEHSAEAYLLGLCACHMQYEKNYEQMRLL